MPRSDRPPVRVEEIDGEAVATVDHELLIRCDSSLVTEPAR